MSNKRIITTFFIGVFLGMLVLTPILNYFGFTPIEDLLTAAFGPRNLLVVIFFLMIFILVVVIFYRVIKRNNNN